MSAAKATLSSPQDESVNQDKSEWTTASKKKNNKKNRAKKARAKAQAGPNKKESEVKPKESEVKPKESEVKPKELEVKPKESKKESQKEDLKEPTEPKKSKAQQGILAKPKYQPIEHFMMKIMDYQLTAWLSDQIGVLRSIFELYTSREPVTKFSFEIGPISCEVNRRSVNDVKIFVPSISKENYSNPDHHYEAQLFHLADGTVLLALRSRDELTIYHFCFEESDDRTFERIVRESQEQPRSSKKN